MLDKTKRIVKVGDALSQLFNVALLPNHHNTTANESISGRAYRLGWFKTVKFIDSVLGKDHCKESYLNDIDRASQYLHDNSYLVNTDK